jgi:cytochrome c oxidase subunit III
MSTDAILMTASPTIDVGVRPGRVGTPPDDRDGRGRGGPGGGGPGGFGPGGSDPGDTGKPAAVPDPGQMAATAMWIALAPILMLFMAFVSAYAVRMGLGQGWVAVPWPRLLWLNTGVLLVSSLALERARREAKRGGSAVRLWLGITLALGLAFVVGQLYAWRLLLATGIGISSSPASSFFYLLTGTHAAHLAGGMIGLSAVTLWPASGFRRIPRPTAIRIAAIYWHFMGVLWVGLFLLLMLWR